MPLASRCEVSFEFKPPLPVASTLQKIAGHQIHHLMYPRWRDSCGTAFIRLVKVHGVRLAAVVSRESDIGEAEIHLETGHLPRRERAVTAARDFIERDTVAAGCIAALNGVSRPLRSIIVKWMWPWSNASRIQ